MIVLIFLAILYVFISIIFGYVCDKYLILTGDAVVLIFMFWPFVLLFMIFFNAFTSIVKKFADRG